MIMNFKNQKIRKSENSQNSLFPLVKKKKKKKIIYNNTVYGNK
jgi:hypothetical protein